MLRILLRLGAVLASVLFVTTVHTGPASAFGGETVGCRISPGRTFTFTEFCTNDRPIGGTCTVAFAVQNLSGAGYTFSWSLSGHYLAVVGGCGSTDSTCRVSVSRATQELVGSVNWTQAGQTGSGAAYADIEPWCGQYLC